LDYDPAFILSKAAQTVQLLGKPDAVFTFFDTAYANQAEIYNSATADMTYNQVSSM
jgi:hypothetical protein